MLALVIYNILAIYLTLSDLKFETFRQIVVIVMVIANLGSFVLILFIHLFTHFSFIVKLLWNTMSYLSFQGAYSQTMVIYGMCNVDDVSWGTKGASGSG
jgi:chitin synthase